MSTSPGPSSLEQAALTQPPNPRPPRRSYSTLLKVAYGLGSIVALAGVAGGIWGDRIINAQAIPRIEAELEEIVERPIELGKVEGFSFWGVRLGKATMPPTATDESFATVETVKITIDLRSLIFERTLRPKIILVRPDVSLAQSEDGQWLEIGLPEPAEEDPLISLEIRTIEVQEARLTASIFDRDSQALIPREPIEVTEANVLLSFYTEASQRVDVEAAGEIKSGSFEINGEADLEKRAVKANVRSHNLPITSLNLLLPSGVGIASGTLDGNLTLTTALTEDAQLDQSATDLRGTARLQAGDVRISQLTQPIRNIRSRLLFKGQQVTLEETGLQVNGIDLTASGDVDFQKGYNLTAQIPAVTLAEVKQLADIALPVAASGTFQLNTQVTGELTAPLVRGHLASRQPLQIEQLSIDSAVADFSFSLPQFKLSQVDLTELRIVPQAGGTVIASGQADLTSLQDPSFQLTAQANLPADAFARTYGLTVPEDITIGSLTADVIASGRLRSPIGLAQWQLSNSTFPGQGEIIFADNVVTLENTRLQVAGGTVDAQALLQLETGDWQTSVITQQVPVEQFTAQAEGLLSTELSAVGNLDALDLVAIEAQGTAAIADATIRLTETSQPLIDPGTWRTAFQWQGDNIIIDSFTAPGVQADGVIGIDFTQSNPIDNLALNVALKSIDLALLNSVVPTQVADYAQISGFTSFDGQLTGTLTDPRLAGEARLANLALNELLFEPLSGPVDFALSDGGLMDLQGQRDRLQLVVGESLQERFRDRTWPATSFKIRNQDFVVTGYGEDRQLHADIVQFPLGVLDIRSPTDLGLRTTFGRPLGPVTGLLDASIDANLQNFSDPAVEGALAITQPALNPIEAQQLTANFRYANNTATLEQGELRFDDSQYLLTGSANLSSEVQYEGELTIAEGRIEDLVSVLEKIDLTALGIMANSSLALLGSATDLATEPVELPAGSLLEKLESFVTFLEVHPDTDTADAGVFIIPSLDDLAGRFTGVIEVAGRSSALADLTADFTLQGNSWTWGTYAPPNRFFISGDVQQRTVSIDSAVMNAGDTAIDLSGSGNLDQLEGQLRIDNLPVELAASVYPLPVSVAGDLDVLTRFNGSLANPIVEGEAVIDQTQINEYPIEQVGATFSYRNAQLAWDSEVAIAPTDTPITFAGNLLYALPFMTVQPPTEQLVMTAVVPSDSFDVINTLTNNQIRWEEGTGEIVTQVSGTLQQPVVVGQASFREGTLSSDFLGDSLTNLNGDIQFDLTQINVQQLQANMGDGQLAVIGQLPLLPSGQSVLANTTQIAQVSQTKQNQQKIDGLVVSLEGVPLDYSGILEAVFEGQVWVTGAVLAPTISGDLELANGQVQANQLLAQAGSMSFPMAEALAEISPYRIEYLDLDPGALPHNEQPDSWLDNVTLQNFTITLGDRISIIGQPLYNISALGNLTVSGPLKALQPSGVIELKSGWINLFSTQFRLDSNAANTAIFSPEMGLDPFVDVVMTARVQDSDVTPAPLSAGGFLSADVAEDTGVETIGEINYISVEAVANGPASDLSNSLTLTSNSARSQGELLALLGSNVFTGLTTGSYAQFAGFLGAGRLANFGNNVADALNLQSFSVFPTTDPDSESAVGIGIGVEATARLGDRINISALEILNSDTPPQLGLQYRLTDGLKLRGSSNLDDSQFRLEYQINF